MVRIPSTQALRALDSFARHGSVWQAAGELNLTRSAVSHQLRLLERDLGFRLLNRVGTRVELTPQGRAYADDVRLALAAIAGSAGRNAGRGVSGPLTVSATAGFAAAWLCPRIGRFRAACPEVALSIVTPRRVDDVSNPEADAFIAFGGASLDGAELLRAVAFTPLCSPALINRLGGIGEPADVLRAGLLHLHDPADWRAWFRLARLDEADAAVGIAFSDVNLVYAAALGGQGIALGDEFICHEAMVAGRLVRPFDLAVPSAQAYRLLVPPARVGNPAVVAFCRWLRSELSDSPA